MLILENNAIFFKTCLLKIGFGKRNKRLIKNAVASKKIPVRQQLSYAEVRGSPRQRVKMK